MRKRHDYFHKQDIITCDGGRGVAEQLEEWLRPVRLLPYQRAAVLSGRRFTWNNWSRQTGKSFAFTLRRLLRGMARRRTQLLLSAGQRQSQELMLKVAEHCRLLSIACELRDSPLLEGVVLRRSEVRLANGVRVIALPANPLTARGYTADVLLDEFAMHRDDRAIWAALLPALLRDEGELDVASTPRGRENMFARLRNNAQFATSTVTLPEAIAQGLVADEAEIRKALDDERLYRQEFLCEFDDDEDAFLSHDAISACVDESAPREIDLRWAARCKDDLFLGIDVGRLRDLTVMWLWQRDGDLLHSRGRIELARRPFDEQQRLLAELMQSRAIRRCCIDASGMGLALAEQAVARFGEERVEMVVFTPGLQSQMASRMRVWIEQRRVTLPADDAVRRDFHSLRRVVSTSGHVRLVAPRSGGSHADRFWAAALGLHAADGVAVGGAGYEPAGSLRFARGGTW